MWREVVGDEELGLVLMRRRGAGVRSAVRSGQRTSASIPAGARSVDNAHDHPPHRGVRGERTLAESSVVAEHVAEARTG